MQWKIALLSVVLLSSCQSELDQESEILPTDKALIDLDASGQLALVTLDTQKGLVFGCGDSIAFVSQELDFFPKDSYTAKVEAALNTLFAIGDSTDSGYYNALAGSNLTVGSMEWSDYNGLGAEIDVDLSGSLTSGGVCDDPRIQEQIFRTAQANTPESTVIAITIDGQPLDEYFDLSGE